MEKNELVQMVNFELVDSFENKGGINLFVLDDSRREICFLNAFADFPLPEKIKGRALKFSKKGCLIKVN